MEKADELLNQASFYYRETIEVESCSRCNGIGRNYKEELADYHRGEYIGRLLVCKQFKGDGRVVKKKREIVVSRASEEQVVPYSAFEGDPFDSKTDNFGFSVKRDLRCRHYENKYPELKDLTYEKYDELLEKLRAFERLKK